MVRIYCIYFFIKTPWIPLENLILGVPVNCQFIQGDFMELPFEDNSFDHVYVIEAVCHAPEKVYYYIFYLEKKRRFLIL